MANIPSPRSSRRSNKRVAARGEAGILALARRYFAAGPACAPGVVCGIGDDAAVCRSPRARWLELLTVDTLVAGTHFGPGTAPTRIGWKALAVNLSDIAAMGGIPTVAVVSVTLTGRETLACVEALMQGMAAAARRFGVAIVGGDTVGGPALSITVALAGRVEPRCVCYRSGAQPGDLIAVTGPLGGSLRSGRHLDFMPRLAEARWLVRHAKPTAMMDLSDGLAMDGNRLALASKVALRLNARAIPVSPGSTLAGALHDGEDFELLCTFAPAALTPRVRAAFARRFGRPLALIGAVARPPVKVTVDGVALSSRGFDHFASAR